MSDTIDELDAISRDVLPHWFTAAATDAVVELTKATIDCVPGAHETYQAKIKELQAQLREERQC